MSINSLFAKIANFINNNSTVQTIVLHTLIGSTILYHLEKIPGVWAPLKVYGVFLALTSLKEFYWDKHFEIPNQSFLDSLYDWTGWQAGAILSALFFHFGI